MRLNLKAVVRYDGTDFRGWQIQPGQPTVQGAIEAALTQIASAPISVAGAGRTDSGVHALGQVCSFRWPEEIPFDRLRRALSGMLKPAIRIESIEQVPEDFHARKSARAKRYVYTVDLAREADPFSCRYAWSIPWAVDLAQLERLAVRLVGRHDFAGFQGSGSEVLTTVRTLFSVNLAQGGVIGPKDARSLWRIEFHGDGFLYKMVRNITGTLMDIARGRLAPARLDELLVAQGPYLGHTAPARGLTLAEVEYDTPHAEASADWSPQVALSPF